MRVAVLGAWHLGAVAAAVVAGWGRAVSIWDRDPLVRAGLAEGRPQVDETGLASALADAGTLLSVQDRATPDLAGHDVVLIAYDTPVDASDRPDLTPVEEALDIAAKFAQKGSLVLLHSQVPVGTTDRFRAALDDAGREDLLLAVTPENLRLGSALNNFSKPGFLAVGTDSPDAAALAREFWAPTGAHIEVVAPATAEIAKHIINATLAAATALGNEIGGLAKIAKADATAAARLAKQDPRLAGLPILPGLPFGGGTLARDLGILAELSGPSSLTAAVQRANRARLDQLVERIATASRGPVCFLGLTYKPGTSTLRRSIALEIAQKVADRGYSVRAHDPHVHADDFQQQSAHGVALLGLADATRGASTIVVTTAHLDFAQLGPCDLSNATVVIDLVGGLNTKHNWSGIDVQGP